MASPPPSSPLLRVSLYQRASDGCPAPRDFLWPDFAAVLLAHTEAPPGKEKRELPAFSFAEYPPGCTSRHLKHVRSVHGAVFDLDNVPGEVVADWLQRAEGAYHSVLYTTWSHGLEGDLWRARVVLPFSRPVPVERWPSVWHSICELILPGASTKVLQDAAKCRDASHLFFGPICPAGSLSRHTAILTQGTYLDALSLPAPSGPMAVLASPETKIAITRERLTQVRKQWERRKGWERWAECLRAVIAGEPFAEPGHRDTTAWTLCTKLAEAIPEADPQRLAEHFIPSIAMMGGEPTQENIADKLDRAYRDAAVRIQEEEGQRAQRIRQAFAHVDPDRDWGYLEHEIDEFSKLQGCSRAELRNRWILQRGSEFRFLVAGKYSSPYNEKEAAVAALRELAPAETAGVVLRFPDGGAKGIGLLCQDYGTACASYCYDLAASASSYDAPSRTYREACSPIRPDLGPPLFDGECARWLELLAGETHHIPLLTWLAYVTSLRRTAAALMVTGPPGIGKSLLSSGLARIWTKGNATTIEQAFGGFNEALIHCPLVVSDEVGIPRVPGKSRTNEFRRLIADHNRDLRKKYAHDAQLFGCVRVIVVANNESVLSFDGEHLTDHDIAAVAERIYHIPVPTALPKPDYHESIVYLRSVKGGAGTFVTEDRLARHVLWLRDNARTLGLEPHGRFLIGDDGKIARTMTYRTNMRSLALEWIATYLLRKGPKPPALRGNVFQKGGRLYVQPRAMLEAWDSVMAADQRRPDLSRFAQAVAGLAEEVRKVRLPPHGHERAYYIVNLEILSEWSDWTQNPTDELRSVLVNDSEDATL